MNKDKSAKAQELVYEGWETMGYDIYQAKRLFEEAIELDSGMADAYNGLGAIASEEGDLELAGRYYREAYEKAKIRLGTEDPEAFLWWQDLATRPYMRARHCLGLVFMGLERFDEAIIEFKELLKRNPSDDQGVRYLVAPIYLLKDDIKGAILEFEWSAHHYPDDLYDPYYLLNWGLALFLDGQYEESAIKFRATIFYNPYLIPIVLGREPKVLPIFHSSNLMEIEYAYEYPMWYGRLWARRMKAQRFLKFLWDDPEIQEDYMKWVEYRTKLAGLEDINGRSSILHLSRMIENKRPTAEFFNRLHSFLSKIGI